MVAEILIAINNGMFDVTMLDIKGLRSSAPKNRTPTTVVKQSNAPANRRILLSIKSIYVKSTYIIKAQVIYANSVYIRVVTLFK